MIAVVIFICSRDSQDPRGYWMDRLGTLKRPADSACIYGVEIQLMCRIPTREWTVFRYQSPNWA
jgi:hypothetical protein